MNSAYRQLLIARMWPPLFVFNKTTKICCFIDIIYCIVFLYARGDFGLCSLFPHVITVIILLGCLVNLLHLQGTLLFKEKYITRKKSKLACK